jgi:hypothetical protein
MPKAAMTLLSATESFGPVVSMVQDFCTSPVALSFHSSQPRKRHRIPIGSGEVPRLLARRGILPLSSTNDSIPAISRAFLGWIEEKISEPESPNGCKISIFIAFHVS